VLAGVFYLLFIFNIAQSTADYWAGRISGNVSSKISSSRYLFSVYQPIYVLHLYTLLLIGGLAVAGLNLLNKFQLVNFPRLIWAILIWFLFPLLIIEVLIYIPGTHIYTYLIPGCLLMGFVLSYIEHLIAIYVKPLKPLIPVGLWIMTLFLFLQSYYIFVDHQSEYPWEQKRFLIWTLPKPTPIFHLSIFGFPYYRHWDEVGDYIAADQQADYYTTNERVSIARYHINLEKDGERAGYYVYIKQPQTFTDEITNEGIVNWVATHPPVAEFQNNSRVVTQIFLVNRNEPVTSSN
ncbi:hypothetical protein KKG63_01850, partial [Patescibacteria group bacterium]|nr:hypothetical protein [Patescibacteria group bacterium]